MTTQTPESVPSQARWNGLPPKQGLYDPQMEHDACGVGFVVNIKGQKSHEIVQQGLKVLVNLDHRGACGCEANTGDGAGILMQIPHKFFSRVAKESGFELPEPGLYGVAMVFLPRDAKHRRYCERAFERIVREEGQKVLGWRNVPTDNSMIGATAKATEPVFRQCFIGRNRRITDDQAFERRLFIIRKRAYLEVRNAGEPGTHFWYVASMSCRTVGYKGMLMPAQVDQYFPDLRDPDMESALALVHSRFSTNTFPSWERAHPYRYLAHNGEINTLRGNINWMHARQAMFESELLGDRNEIKKILPIINPNGNGCRALTWGCESPT